MTAAHRSVLPFLLSVAAAWACGGSDLVIPPDAETSQVQVHAGDDQLGLPGSRLPDPLIVRLVDQTGTGIPNRAVVWTVRTGGGAVNPATGTTDAEGFASAEWTLGPTAGANVVDAQVPGIGVVTFTAMATPDDGGGGEESEPSAANSSVAAEPASIPAGTGTATITVTVRDGNGAPVEGATVTLDASGDNTTLTQPSGPTGADGIAVGSLQSTTPGEKVVSAMVNGMLEVSETARVTVTAAPAARIELSEGDDQTAPAGDRVPVRPAVLVTDALGEPVAGVEVTFEVTAGGGRVEGATQTTDGDGIARVDRWTLGPSPGTNTLEASAGLLDGSPVVFSAEGAGPSGGEVDRLVFRVPPRDVEVDEPFRVSVALVDAEGEVVPLSGIFIYVGLFPEGSESPTNDFLFGERFENTEDGIAEFDIAVERAGRFRLRALTDDLPELGPHGPEPWLYSEVFEVE